MTPDDILSFRVDVETMELVDAHRDAMQHLVLWTKVKRSDAARDLLLKGLQSLHQDQPTSPSLPTETPPAPPAPATLPPPVVERESKLDPLYTLREEYPKLSLREFAQLAFDRGVYRAKGTDGSEKPINPGTLSKMLAKAGMV